MTYSPKNEDMLGTSIPDEAIDAARAKIIEITGDLINDEETREVLEAVAPIIIRRVLDDLEDAITAKYTDASDCPNKSCYLCLARRRWHSEVLLLISDMREEL